MSTVAMWAAKLNGGEYPFDLSASDQAQAKADGVVIVFGSSDDLIEFRGAIYDEAGCCDGGTIIFDAKGPLPSWDEVRDDRDERQAEAYFSRKRHARTIAAIWCPKGADGKIIASWTYDTDVPHETFDVMEDGELYCRGIVFNVSDL